MPNVLFNIYNRNNTELLPATGYSLPFEIFKFIPNFTSVGNSISDKKILWNFGDNVMSSSLTAFHSYEFPGIYPVTLTVFDSAGNGSLSTYLSTIIIQNLINDNLVLTTSQQLILKSGETNLPIYLTRYNSYQTSVSGLNTIINLAVSGNQSPFFDMQEYDSDKYAHLKPSAKFFINTTAGFTVVNAVTTTNDFIYATPGFSSVRLSTSATQGSYLAGSSGTAIFYYVEDFWI